MKLSPSSPNLPKCIIPILILADSSGSMEQDDKIIALNHAITEMIKALVEQISDNLEIQMAAISFGGVSAKIHQELSPVQDIEWYDLEPSGRTPMGMAFEKARTIIDDKNLIPHNANAPTLVLVSDGIPTDDWQPALHGLLTTERASQATRFAMAIGDDADTDMLREFSSVKLFHAHEARQIRRFFQNIALNIVSR